MAEALDPFSDLAKSLLDQGFNSRTNNATKGEALAWASEKGLASLVRRLLVEGVDVNHKEQGLTALHHAARAGACDVLDILFTFDANITVEGSDGLTPLHLAAAGNKPEAIRRLVSKGVSVDIATATGLTPLYTAAGWGSCDAIRVLGELRANFDCREQNNLSALHVACRYGHLATVKLFLEMGADISSKGTAGLMPLHCAALEGRTAVVTFLLQSGADVQSTLINGENALHACMNGKSRPSAEVLIDHGISLEQKSDHGTTPLALAALLGHSDLVEFLLSKDAAFNTTDSDGFQPLHVAAQESHKKIIWDLIQKGADIEARSSKGHTPLLTAAWNGKDEAVSLLAEHGADMFTADNLGRNALHLAALTDNLFLVDLLIERGGNLNAETKTGQTPLMQAAMHGNREIVAFLINHGANIHACQKSNWQPLHYAAHHGHTDVVELLLQKGANAAAETTDGRKAEDISSKREFHSITELLKRSTPVRKKAKSEFSNHSIDLLVSSAGKGHLDRVTQLLDEGCNVNSADANGRTAISSAAERRQEDVFQLLVERGANVDSLDENGESALWWASRYGHMGIVRQLLDHGACVDAADCDGQTPLSAASQYGHTHVVKLLLQRGGNPNMPTSYGKTPLLFAAAAGYRNTAHVLLRSGAKMNHATPLGDTASSLAKSKGHQSVIKLLQEYAYSMPPAYDGLSVPPPLPQTPAATPGQVAPPSDRYDKELFRASGDGRIPEILRLIRLGANVRGLPKTETPIFNAARLGQENAVRVLIENDADVFLSDKHGTTPLAVAAGFGHASIVRLLHEHGASVEGKNNDQRSPLSYATASGKLEIVELLLSLGARTESKDSQNRTPLWHAASRGHREVCQILLSHGANKEFVDTSGVTPLMASIQGGKRDIARLLLEEGASMRCESKHNLSPLCRAVCEGDEAMVDLLIDHGADLGHRIEDKLTPLHLAAALGHSMVAKLLIEAGSQLNAKDDNGRTALSWAKENSHESVVRLFSQAHTLRQTSLQAVKRARRQGLNQKMSYQYRPLAKELSIRVMGLYPGKPGDILVFDLVEVELGEETSFEALSYEWREKVGTVPVQCNNELLFVTPNCKAAMENLRLESQQRHLWIDAVCINQQDLKERSQQVALMADIYRHAQVVHLWLGDGNASTKAAFDRIPEMVQAHKRLQRNPEDWLDLCSLEERQDVRQLIHDVMQNKDVLSGFRNLYWRPYFTRAWIFQEIVLSGSRGVVICGKQQCSWTMFKYSFLAYDAYSQSSSPPLWFIVWADSKLSREVTADIMAFVVAAISGLEATDSRDKIFAALNFGTSRSRAVQTRVKRPAADYTMTVQEVYVHATRYLINIYQNPFIWSITNRRSTKRIQNLPSWVPEYRRGADDLTNRPFPEPKPEFDEMVSGQPSSTVSSLHINGVIIGKVIFKQTITKNTDTYGVVLSAVRELSRQGRCVYDTYPGILLSPATNESKQTPQQQLRSTNAMALFSTIMRMGVTLSDSDMEMFTFLLWTLAVDENAPAQPHMPDWMRRELTVWTQRSEQPDFDLQVCRRMEDKMRFGLDLVYTENGHFGLTNGGEARERLEVALIGGAEHLTLLERMPTSEGKPWFEYVDSVYMYLPEKVERLSQIDGGAKVERIEIR